MNIFKTLTFFNVQTHSDAVHTQYNTNSVINLKTIISYTPLFFRQLQALLHGVRCWLKSLYLNIGYSQNNH